MSFNGAGGSNGGTGTFFIGLIMMIGGGYLFLKSIIITNNFGMGYGLYSMGGFSLTTGMVLIPFIFGIGIVFFNVKSIIGWLLTGGSLVMLAFGVIASIEFRFQRMSAFELIIILVLLVGGIGLFARSLMEYRRQ